MKHLDKPVLRHLGKGEDDLHKTGGITDCFHFSKGEELMTKEEEEEEGEEHFERGGEARMSE